MLTWAETLFRIATYDERIFHLECIPVYETRPRSGMRKLELKINLLRRMCMMLALGPDNCEQEEAYLEVRSWLLKRDRLWKEKTGSHYLKHWEGPFENRKQYARFIHETSSKHFLNSITPWPCIYEPENDILSDDDEAYDEDLCHTEGLSQAGCSFPLAQRGW